ncbi:C2 calcium-dependent domain-containing protein 4C-like [Anguilla anguilla]|uniref:C2 calcium-dependent domain-containing protein 4C-like n=1 Tax=Anguilla anguilla TaxID=7936 RepID=UPI0015AA66A4|nr:C2 calcium-dependent domain-containing protein 4C-like [Anguilla anguilla]
MKRNIAVTRTVSAGSCSVASLSRTFSTPEDAQPYTARRHSSAGVRALKWATASARSFGSSLVLENRSSKDNLFNIVVTPDSIPQFTIPSLALQDGLRFSSPASSSSGFGSSPRLERRAHRSVSDPTSNNRLPHDRRGNCALLEGQDFPDPVTRAAFSLPHLPKVTTPYGFLTLSRSPQMADEEALLFQAGHRRCLRDEEGASRGRTPDLNENSTSRTGRTRPPAGTSCPAQLVRRRSSPDRRILETGRAKQNVQGSARRPKSRFWAVLQKHFTNLKEKSQ